MAVTRAQVYAALTGLRARLRSPPGASPRNEPLGMAAAAAAALTPLFCRVLQSFLHNAIS